MEKCITSEPCTNYFKTGRGIICEDSPEDPGKRSRVWHKDASNVLRKLTGPSIPEGINWAVKTASLLAYFISSSSSAIKTFPLSSKHSAIQPFSLFSVAPIQILGAETVREVENTEQHSIWDGPFSSTVSESGISSNS
ncbi:hypothetical protein L3X38_015529 [Prunus dulcis]|uniref:Uncharacterized protein n=1 Tax=Prunus dulcis TaxID=3755 RepID=A0AAD4Z7B9_PRUDU|nr:hypothetical protein L3X38_015529 [Prunus dulcis]